MSTRKSKTAPAGGASSLWRRLAYGLYLVVAVLLILEICFRVTLALQIGPRVLAYGTPWYRNAFGEHRKEQLIEQYDQELVVWNENEDTLDTVSEHNNAKGGYLKFFPNETKYFKDIDTGEIVPVTINSHGFRGADFSAGKPDGVVRVLTLGASSTFGFYSRDHETYPFLLEQRLNARCSGPQRFEVINFAIPHAGAEEIRAMLVAEGLTLDPDVLTFYEGRNDSHRIHPMDFRQAASRTKAGEGWPHEVWDAMTDHFVLARFIDGVSTAGTQVTAGDALESLRTVSGRTARAFIQDLEEIRKVAKRDNIDLIVANQQANAKSWFGIPQAQRMELKGITYRDEVAAIERRLARGAAISGYEFNFLIHARLMTDLEIWARENGVPFVDLIGALDQERHHLVSWVHLDAYANGLVADALADEILRRKCPTQ